MKFKTEFKFDPIVTKNHTDVNRSDCEFKLGQMISETFGWQRKNETTQDGVLGISVLEIEAFPVGKWIEFKQRLFTEIYEKGRRGAILDQALMLELIKELESFGKPEEAAKG